MNHLEGIAEKPYFGSKFDRLTSLVPEADFSKINIKPMLNQSLY